MPHCHGAAGSKSPSWHRHTDGEQWVVELPLHIATLAGSNGQCEFFKALPHATVPGGGTLAKLRHTAGEQWAEGLLLYSPTLWGAVGSGSLSVHRHPTRE